MGGDFYSFLPKSKFIIKIPRGAPSILRIFVLAVVVMCSIYISLVCLNQTTILIKPELLLKIRPLEKDSSDSRIFLMNRSKILIEPETMSIRPVKQHSYDPTIVVLEQSATSKISISETTKFVEKRSYDRRISSLVETEVQEKPESLIIRPVDLKRTEIQDKPVQDRRRRTHLLPYDSYGTTGLNQTAPSQSSCADPRIPQSEIPYIHYPVPTKFSRRECACTPVRFYVIVSMQRSGSGWLESLLSSHGNISSNGEIFMDRQRSANVSAITSTLDTVYNLDWEDSIKTEACVSAVGFKWMLNQGIIENHEEVSNYFTRRGVSVIFLFRKNLLRRMISHLANSHDFNQTNGVHKSHVVTRQEANTLASYRPELKAKTLVRKLKRTAGRIAEAKEHFKRVRHMVLYYEDLVQNNTQKLTEIMEFLRVPQTRLSSKHVKIHTRPISEMVQNWNVVREALKRSEFESFLSSD